MSESDTEELAPLAPTEETGEVAIEPQAEATEAETTEEQPQDRFSKPLQRVQMENANLRKDVAELKNLILAQAAKPQTAAVKDELDSLLEAAKAEYGDSSPSLMKVVNALAEEVRKGNATRSDLQRKLEEVQGSTSYEKFISGRPPEFREKYAEAHVELAEAFKREYGEEPTPRELRFALTAWTKTWDETHKPTTRSNTTSAPRRSTVIPSGAGARNQSQPSLAEALASGKVPDGKGGYKPGNLLGI